MPTKKDRRPRGEYTDAFSEFYSRYPRKAGKQQAQWTWDELGLEHDHKLRGHILARLGLRNSENGWPRDKTKVPHPSTWLNTGGWHDEWEEYTKAPRDSARGGGSFQSAGPVKPPEPAPPRIEWSPWQAAMNGLAIQWMRRRASLGMNFSPQFFRDAQRERDRLNAEIASAFDEEWQQAGRSLSKLKELQGQVRQLIAARWKELPSFSDNPPRPTLEART